MSGDWSSDVCSSDLDAVPTIRSLSLLSALSEQDTKQHFLAPENDFTIDLINSSSDSYVESSGASDDEVPNDDTKRTVTSTLQLYESRNILSLFL